MKRSLGVALALGWATSVAWAQTPTVDLSRSGPLAPLAGPMSTPAWYQTDTDFHGTDMGFLFKHKGALWIAFGDTVANSVTGEHIKPPPGNPPGDDALGAICLQPSIYCPAFVPWFTTGADVDNYVATFGPGPGELSWEAEGPPVLFHTYTQGGNTKILPISVYNGGIFGTPRNEIAPIPGPGFSNYKSGSASGAFVMFNGPIARCNWPCPPGVTCVPGTGCPTGFVCNTSLGVLDDCTDPNRPCVFSATDGGYVPCDLATNPNRNICHDTGGVCTDPAGGVASRFEIGNADPNVPSRFFTKSWVNFRMQNSAVTTVNNFDKNRSIYGLIKNDYRSPTGLPSSSNKVFMWGHLLVAPAGLAHTYFAYVDMPSYSSTGNFAWQPQYFTGFNPATGRASFSPNEVDAKPIDMSGLSSSWPAAIKTPETEEWSYGGIGLAVRWIEPLKKFVMIYGGGFAPLFDAPPDPNLWHFDPKNAMHVRFADHPWGPWSPPQPFFEAGNPEDSPSGVPPATQYGQGGILYHIECPLWGDDCAPGELFWKFGEHVFHGEPPLTKSTHPFGFLYGPNIIEEWSMSRSSPVPGVDIYWTVSTFAPYQVVLMRTRINK